MRPARSVFAAVLSASLLVVLPAWSALAEDHWVEVRSPHFRVLTNGSAADGRRVVDEFEQVRYVIHYRFPTLRLDASAPLLIVAARDGDTARKLEPELAKHGGDRIAGNFIEGWARNCAMVRLDEWSRGAREVVYHEYTHSIFHLNSHWLPTWLDEGMAEFFAYTRFMDHKIYLGAPTERARFLDDGRLIPVSEMLIDRPSNYERDERKMQLFYAEAWAMVHYMTFGPNMDQGRKLAGFFDDLQNGKDQKTAFAERFGSVDLFDRGLRSYANKFSMTAGIVPPPPSLDATAFTSRPLSPAEADYELGTFHISEYDTADGRKLIEQALALDPKLAGPHEEMGYLLFGEGKDAEARAQWKEAATLDPTLYRARFAYLMMGVPFARQTAEQQQGSLAELRAILHVNPYFAPAYVEVALLQWQQGNLDTASRAADQAARMEPWRVGYRMLDGHILLAQGRGSDAAKIARAAAQFAEGTDRAEAVALWLEVPPAQRGDGPSLSYDLPSGVQVAQGTLTSFACGNREKGTKFAVDFQPSGNSSSSPIHLTPPERVMLGTADTLYRGERRMSPCAHSTGRNALVAYKPTQAGAGELVWLQVMDDLPALRAVATATSATALLPTSGTPATAK